MKKEYQYLLWDIDATILDFKKPQNRAVRLLFEEYGFGECSDAMLERYDEINQAHWRALERGEMTKSEILVKRFEVFFAEIGADISVAKEFNQKYNGMLGDLIVFIDGAKETLLKCKEKYTQVVITNGTKLAQVKKLKNSGLDKIFDGIYISEDVGFEKPSKEYFDLVCERSGIKDRSKALVIGDSLTSDMLGGVNAGIDTCWYNPNHKKNDKGLPLTYEIADFEMLEKILF